MQVDPGTHERRRLRHHMNQPAATPAPLAAIKGTRQGASASSIPKIPALAPKEASRSGMTQHDEATMAPSPVTVAPTASTPSTGRGVAGAGMSETIGTAVGL